MVGKKNLLFKDVMIPEINKKGERGEKEMRKENSFHSKKNCYISEFILLLIATVRRF